MEYTLSLTFIADNGENVAINISDVKASITKVMASQLMATIIEKNVFFTKHGALVRKSNASVTSRQVSKYDMSDM